ncbi:uncharacterized protein LOC105699101 [Orussus abietinus]|uniref:uncharacterized protein LOC105699101 n=1 Tax=Orussus abietinus TaxID=222816 RepID=UPI0006257D91|nr:uncharacterized protein LOC105699101 [Orussus abietinus]
MCEVDGQPQINESYCFKWADYQNHLSGVVRQLLEEDCMVDVTLSADGERIHAHRIVLCACSTLFQEVLSQATEDHPTIIISDISARDIRSIVEFTYHGEVRIPVENIGNLLDAAHSLKICGLMEIDGLDENETIGSGKDINENNTDNTEPLVQLNESENKVLDSLESEYETSQGQLEQTIPNDIVVSKRRRRKRDSVKREYNEDMLAAAINDLRSGQTLIEASTKHNIPRSTLYMRAKALGIHLNASRNEYPMECMKAAINAVIGGASLQNASEMFNIPKTVLWRRIQKEGYQILRSEMKRSYGSDKREAAVKALERGENLTKVALKFQIPKTTLFRDKARLVDEGKLPVSFWKKRKSENEELKRLRLEEAVAACKEGKMSQAAASMTYRIPKTTIWRRLQQDSKKHVHSLHAKRQRKLADSANNVKMKSEPESGYSYCEVSSEIPITYIDENSIPEDSVIILTTEDMDGINLEGRQIIVNSEPGQDYAPCTLNIEGSSTYQPTES